MPTQLNATIKLRFALMCNVSILRVLLTVIGLSFVTFIIIKRRAISKALSAHQEIRYERADSDDDGIGSVHSGMKANNRRTDVF